MSVRLGQSIVVTDRLLVHFVGLGAAVGGWLGFYLAGLPDYYQQYRDRTMVIVVLVFAVVLWPAAIFGVRFLGRSSRYSPVYIGILLSAYLAVVPAAIDYVYLGLYEDHGFRFFTTYWYLTAFYVLPAPFLIGAGLRIKARDANNQG